VSTLTEREEAFEKRFALDEDRRFHARVLRDRRLGEWAAERIGVAAESRESFARRFADDLVGKDDETVVAAAIKLFADAGIEMSAVRIRRKAEAELAEALRFLTAAR